MTGFGKAVLSATLASVVVIAGHALADTQKFDLEAIEVQEANGQAIIAMDVPEGSEVKSINNPQRGELTVTFTGVSLRLPKRVHSGAPGDAVSSVDVEPWFVDGKRVTRMVVRYPEGAVAEQLQEGDVLMVTVAGPPGSAESMTEATETDAEDAAEGAADAVAENAADAANEIADEADTAEAETAETADDVAEAVAEPVDEAEARMESAEAMARETDDVAETMAESTEPESSELVADAADVEASPMDVQDTAPEPLPGASDISNAENDTNENDESREPMTEWPTNDPMSKAAPYDEPVSATEPMASAEASRQTQTAANAPASQETVTYQRVGQYGQGSDAVSASVTKPTSDVVLRSGRVQDTQPGLPDMDQGPTITIDLQGADIRTVIRSLSETSGWNIVANADVNGEVSLKLDDVPWRRALTIVCKTQNLGYVVEEGVIRVANAEALRAEVIARETAARKADELVPLETTVVPVRFAAANELLIPVQTLLSSRGKIKEDLRTNALVITDIPSVLPQVNELITRLDGKTPQVEIVAKLVDIDVRAIREFGINWGLTNLHSTSQGISAEAFVNSGLAQSAGTVNFGVIRDFADLDVTLDMLEQNQRANIISNPKISTVNNREARILVGQEIPLIVQDEAGNPITELKKIGIELRVTPYINQDGLVTLDLHPEVSDLASQSTASGGVIINTSEADTRVMVANGETAVIGGLIRANDTVVKSGVPVLHRLPIVGGLFGSESKADAKRELVIFVTPRIIE